MSSLWVEHYIHDLENIRGTIREIILNGDIILRDRILSGLQFYVLYMALKGLLTHILSFTQLIFLKVSTWVFYVELFGLT